MFIPFGRLLVSLVLVVGFFACDVKIRFLTKTYHVIIDLLEFEKTERCAFVTTLAL